MQNYFKSGSWNVICDVCGRKYKNTDVKKRWDGLIVCNKDYELRHIADFIRSNPERNNVKDPRPEQADVFVDVTYISTGDAGYCSLAGRSATPGYSVAGCMTPSKIFNGGL